MKGCGNEEEKDLIISKSISLKLLQVLFLEKAMLKVFNPPRHESGRSACSHRRKCWKNSGMWYMLQKIIIMVLCCDVCNKAWWYRYDDCNMLIMFIVLTAAREIHSVIYQNIAVSLNFYLKTEWVPLWCQCCHRKNIKRQTGRHTKMMRHFV